MARQFQPKRFFRQAPNSLLKQYFEAREIALDLDWKGLAEAQVDPIFDAWLKLPDDLRLRTEGDFRDVDALANEAGMHAIVDEAAFHGEELGAVFAELEGFTAKALWILLERVTYWPAALAFLAADTVPEKSWRKRKNVPRVVARVEPPTIAALASAIGGYFHNNDGRGSHCHVDCYRRDRLDYFFVYPEDYADAAVEWAGEQFTRRTFRPAFEIIFVYSQDEGTVDLYAKGPAQRMAELQALFASVILGEALGPDQKDENVYDLDVFRNRQFEFVYAADSGITDMVVTKLRLERRGRRDKIVLETSSKAHRGAIFSLLDEVTSPLPLAEFRITQVGIAVTFAPGASSRRAPTRRFEITSPNSVALKQEGRDLIIRKVLVASGVEPRPPAQAALAGAPVEPVTSALAAVDLSQSGVEH